MEPDLSADGPVPNFSFELTSEMNGTGIMALLKVTEVIRKNSCGDLL